MVLGEAGFVDVMLGEAGIQLCFRVACGHLSPRLSVLQGDSDVSL